MPPVYSESAASPKGRALTGGLGKLRAVVDFNFVRKLWYDAAKRVIIGTKQCYVLFPSEPIRRATARLDGGSRAGKIRVPHNEKVQKTAVIKRASVILNKKEARGKRWYNP